MIRTFSKKRNHETDTRKFSAPRRKVIKRFSEKEEKDDDDVVMEKLDSILSRIEELEKKLSPADTKEEVEEECDTTEVSNSEETEEVLDIEEDSDFISVDEEEVVQSLSDKKVNKNSQGRNDVPPMLGQESFSCLFK